MALVKCEQGHYYDTSKNTRCPYCERKKQGIRIAGVLSDAEAEEMREQLTVYADSDGEPHLFEGIKTEIFDMPPGEEQRTIGFFEERGIAGCVTGWLVCRRGEQRGKSFPLHGGWNYAGRSLAMDVVISGDLTVERENHLALVYDDRRCETYAAPLNGAVLIDGQVLTEAAKLKDGTKLEIGEGVFEFVPYCRKGRNWNEED